MTFSASEVTTVWRYRNSIIIIIINQTWVYYAEKISTKLQYLSNLAFTVTISVKGSQLKYAYKS